MPYLYTSNHIFDDFTELSFPKGCLNFLSSHEILEILYLLLNDGNNKIDILRAKNLINTIIPILVWIRDNKKIPFHACYINQAISLKWMDRIIHEAKAIFYLKSNHIDYILNKNTNLNKKHIDISDMPEQFFLNIATYLSNLPNYNLSTHLELQTNFSAFDAHNRAVSFFMPFQKIKN